MDIVLHAPLRPVNIFLVAAPKLPSLHDVIADPTILERVPIAVAEALLEQLHRLENSLGNAGLVAPTPVDMALTNPKYQWMDTPHLHYLGDEIANVVDGNSAAIVTMPPRHAKSHTCSVWTPFWFLASRPEDQVLLISYGLDFARKWGVKVRGLVETYGKDYGLEIDPKKTAGDDWQLVTGGGMKTVGVGGGISGNPVKLLIADDLLKDYEEASSAVVRETTWDWWDTTVVQRIEPDTTTIVIGTRYHEDDVIGRMLQHSAAGDGIGFREITLRAKAELDDPLGRAPGEGLWTNHPLSSGGVWGQSFYDKREAAVSAYTWSAVYQQRPSPPGGNMVDPAWWRFYKPYELPRLEQEAQSWDLALDSENKSDSYQCGLVGGRSGALVFLRDGYHEHSKIAPANPGSTEKTVIGAIRNWKARFPQARQKIVERSLAGPMLIQTMQHEVGGMIPWPMKGQRKPSKQANLDACTPEIRAGNVLLPLNGDGSKPRWVQEFIEELRQFPNSPHDDYVDAFSQLMQYLLPGVRNAVAHDHTQAKEYRPIVDAETAHRDALHSIIKKIGSRKIEYMKKIQKRQEGALIPFGRIPTGIAPGLNRMRSMGRSSGRRIGRGMW